MTIAACCCDCVHLTAREVAVLELVAAGLTNDQIGHRLHISAHTVASHVARLIRHLTARNRAELVARAYHAGLFDAAAWPPACVGRRCTRR